MTTTMMTTMTRVDDAPRRVGAAAVDTFPLFARYPSLARLPRARLGTFPSPISRITGLKGEREIWIKRDDLDAPRYGGNKVRALEFLLGEVRPGDTLLTMGGEGSTHVLVTAAMGERLGARTLAIRWHHDMNPAAWRTASAARELCSRIRTTRGPISAYLASLLERSSGDVRWVPPGGSNALGMLGHVNAGLELAGQVARGEMPMPTRVVVPLGTGGTAAGIALGFAVAGLPTKVVAARVVPRIVASRRRLQSLAYSCAKFISRLERRSVPCVRRSRIEVVDDVYGGAYGRPLPAATAAASYLHSTAGILLDDSYSAKAFLAALRLPREETVLFWLTFAGSGGERAESRQQKGESSDGPEASGRKPQGSGGRVHGSGATSG
jgi:D-cysteine desulfhydrase